MKSLFNSFRLVAMAGALALSLSAGQQPDNTEKNKRDRSDAAVTADQQKETAADRELAQKIRKDIVADKSLSTYAHNAKVIARGGTVLLRGPVRTEEEKTKLAGIASRHAGDRKVTNELEIAPAKSN